MLKYKDYLNRAIECSEDILCEEDFNDEINSLFPKLEGIDWEGYYVQENIYNYILEYIIDNPDVWVEDYDTNTKEVCIEVYTSTINSSVLEEIIKTLEYHGWKIEEDCLNSIKNDIQEVEDENMIYDLKSKIDKKLLEYDKEQLTEILNSLSKYDNA